VLITVLDSPEGFGMNLRNTLALSAALAVLAGPAFAQDGDSDVSLEFNIGAATDYVFRGQSQTNNDPQVFAGADVSMGMFYAGTWVSNVDFQDSTDAEIDLYAGITPTLGAISLDLGALYYIYVDAPSGADYNYLELQAKGSVPLGPATFGVGLYYVPNGYQGIDTQFYYEVNGEYSVNDKLSLSAAVGHQTFDGPGDYVTWNVGAGYQLTDNLGFDLRYHDTDKHEFGKTYDSRVVLSAKVTF
jgi:uncharacterized protein (TIGR02001 family)